MVSPDEVGDVLPAGESRGASLDRVGEPPDHRRGEGRRVVGVDDAARHLVDDSLAGSARVPHDHGNAAGRGLARDQLSISGYWRRGRTEDGFREWKSEFARTEGDEPRRGEPEPR